jgi:26S proteasome regulatory subunit N9
MRAMSLGLLKGGIDEVEGAVHVTFVKPRVLDKAQVAVLKERVEAWRDKAAGALRFLEDHTEELLS